MLRSNGLCSEVGEAVILVVATLLGPTIITIGHRVILAEIVIHV